MIQREGKIPEKALSLAREHSFPKEKVHQIWEKWKENKNKECENFRKLYQAPFEIVLYCEGKDKQKTWETISYLSEELHLREVDKDNLLHYFRKVDLWELEKKDKNIKLEEHLLTVLPDEAINKIKRIEIYENQVKIIFIEKETGEIIENCLFGNDFCFIKSKKKLWQPLVFQGLISQEAKEYAQKLIQMIRQNQKSINFAVNVS